MKRIQSTQELLSAVAAQPLEDAADEGDDRSSRVFMPKKVFCGVEGGGTTFRCALAEGDPTNITEVVSIATTSPEETIGKVCAWLRSKGEFDGIGVASFGPVDLTRGSPTFGYITSTPKKGWNNVDLLGPILEACPAGVAYEFDTDVNAPAMAEFTLGGLRQRGCTSCAYVTVGTGIGVGLVVNGQCVHGLLHPEAGHVPVPEPSDGDTFMGLQDRLVRRGAESMCCAGALAARAGGTVVNGVRLDYDLKASALRELPDDHYTFEKAAFYLASLCVDLILIASPERIVLSGGVMQRDSLFPAVRRNVQAILNGYIQHPSIVEQVGIDAYIVPSQWKNDAGIIGALALGQLALLKQKQATVMGVPGMSAPADSRPDAEGYGFVQMTPQLLQGTEDKITMALEVMQQNLQAQIVELQKEVRKVEEVTPFLGVARTVTLVAAALAAGFGLARRMS